MMSYPLSESVRRARDLSESDRSALAADLKSGIAGEVRTDPDRRTLTVPVRDAAYAVP